MKLLQFFRPGQGKRLGASLDGEVIDITRPERADGISLIRAACHAASPLADYTAGLLAQGVSTGLRLEDMLSSADAGPQLLIPFEPPEVWGCGVSYAGTAKVRAESASAAADAHGHLYEHARTSARPELFFKATGPRCVGPREPISIRSDSSITVAEPELAFALSSTGQILAFTICNDVSAWDIERENPLFLNQSKTFLGCCALGPVLVTPDEFGDPYLHDVECRVLRGGQVVAEGAVSTAKLLRKLEDLASYLVRSNAVPDGAVITSGTGIPEIASFPLVDGDTVEISLSGIGWLVNPVRKLTG
jgi:2-dehydro-3-deoxy-D-arabinonate dehydratase